MNCLECQTSMAECSGFHELSVPAQEHLERCAECQGTYPTKPLFRSLLWDAYPEIEPDPRLLASVRQSLYREMERPAWSFFELDFLPRLSFAAGVAVLLAVLALPMLWMGSSRTPPRVEPVLAQVERIEVQSGMASSFGSADALLLVDPLTSLQRASYRAQQVQPGPIVHVIYPFSSRKKPQQRTVVHY